MEKCVIWLIDLSLWLVMRAAFVTVPFVEFFKKGAAIKNSQVKLELPPDDEDLSIAIAFAKESLDDHDRSSAVILEKFKAIMGMYSFSIPILIGFLASRIVLLPHWALSIIGLLVCIPGFCMIKYFSVRTYISRTLSQEDLSRPFRQQQIDQINWYYKKGATINASNNRSFNIYFATYRWLGLAMIVLLFMALLLKFPPTPQSSASTNNVVNNVKSAQELPRESLKEPVKAPTVSPLHVGKPTGR